MLRMFLLYLVLATTPLFADRSFIFDATLSAGRETIVEFPKLQLVYLPSVLPGSYAGFSLGSAFYSGHIGLVLGYKLGDFGVEIAASETMLIRAFSRTKDVGGDYYAFSITPKLVYQLAWLPLSEDDLNNESIRNSYSGVIPFLVVKVGPSFYFVHQFPDAADIALLDRLTPLGVPLNLELGFGLKI